MADKRGTLLARWTKVGQPMYFPAMGAPVILNPGESLELYRVPQETRLLEAIQAVLDSSDAQNARAILAAVRAVAPDQ